MAAFLSALLPGLGQFYNGEWAKGAAFLLGLLVSGALLTRSADVESLQQSILDGNPPENIGSIFLLLVLILALALWSIVDAARSAKRSRS